MARRRRRTLSVQESYYVKIGLGYLGMESLRQYYLSPHWRELCRNWRKKACEHCGARGRLQLHHKTYRNLGRERRVDVETLCDACHRAEHGLPPRRRRGRKRR